MGNQFSASLVGPDVCAPASARLAASGLPIGFSAFSCQQLGATFSFGYQIPAALNYKPFAIKSCIKISFVRFTYQKSVFRLNFIRSYIPFGPFGSFGHGKSLQVTISVSTCSAPIPLISSKEVQLDPPFSGEGSEHVRVLSCVPLPQVFEQSVDNSHSAQFP